METNCPRHCTACEYCFMDYEGAYSEITPGAGAIFRCNRNHWEISFKFDTPKDLWACLRKAETCKDFKRAPWAAG